MPRSFLRLHRTAVGAEGPVLTHSTRTRLSMEHPEQVLTCTAGLFPSQEVCVALMILNPLVRAYERTSVRHDQIQPRPQTELTSTNRVSSSEANIPKQTGPVTTCTSVASNNAHHTPLPSRMHSTTAWYRRQYDGKLYSRHSKTGAPAAFHGRTSAAGHLSKVKGVKGVRGTGYWSTTTTNSIKYNALLVQYLEGLREAEIPTLSAEQGFSWR